MIAVTIQVDGLDELRRLAECLDGFCVVQAGNVRAALAEEAAPKKSRKRGPSRNGQQASAPEPKPDTTSTEHSPESEDSPAEVVEAAPVPATSISEAEFVSAVRAALGVLGIPPVRDVLLAHGYPNALAVPPEQRAVVAAALADRMAEGSA